MVSQQNINVAQEDSTTNTKAQAKRYIPEYSVQMKNRSYWMKNRCCDSDCITDNTENPDENKNDADVASNEPAGDQMNCLRTACGWEWSGAPSKTGWVEEENVPIITRKTVPGHGWLTWKKALLPGRVRNRDGELLDGKKYYFQDDGSCIRNYPEKYPISYTISIKTAAYIPKAGCGLEKRKTYYYVNKDQTLQ